MSSSDPVANLQQLIRCPSVTPAEGGALAALEAMLSPLGFKVERMVATEPGMPDIENLYARLGTDGPHLMFAGHTDVVPPGDEAAWTHPPFAAEIVGGDMFGRGAVDMKGGIACFVAAVARHVETHGAPTGSISFLITGDEEGPAVNGTEKLLKWAADRGEHWDACLVGEPTNPDVLGDMIKIGRRGSVSGKVTLHGVQGHAAYPHLADNPVRSLLALASSLMNPPFDAGTAEFPASNLEVTSVDVGNPATNVIPAKASFAFNIRFNDTWTADTVKAEILSRLVAAATDVSLRPGRDPARYDVVWAERPSHVFLTRNTALIDALTGAVEAVTGRTPQLSTTGGTSDARFIKDYCPVVEFGLVGQTMHMVDERVALADLETLTQIYGTFLSLAGSAMAFHHDLGFHLKGLLLLIQGDARGLQRFDISNAGMARSFEAAAWCLPAFLVGWTVRRAEYVREYPQDPDSLMLFLAKMAVTEVAQWLLPAIVLAVLAVIFRFRPVLRTLVVTRNWFAVPLTYVSYMVLAPLSFISAPVQGATAFTTYSAWALSLAVSAAALVLGWRLLLTIVGGSPWLRGAILVFLVLCQVFFVPELVSLSGVQAA